MNGSLASLVVVLLALPAAAPEDGKEGADPPVAFVLGPGQATATPWRQGSAYTGGGNIHVTQPEPDSISVTMTGAAAAGGHPFKPSAAGLSFELAQGFEVVFRSAEVKGARLVMWARVVGLLRSECPCCKEGGMAEVAQPGHVSVCCGPAEVLALSLPPRAVAGGENRSVHDREGPVWVPVAPGKYTLRQAFGVAAAHGKCLVRKAASAEFAPEPALEEGWLGKREPFHGADKKDFGFQVILKVVADEEAKEKKP